MEHCFHSQSSQTQTKIHFINLLYDKVDAIWLDYEGREKCYHIINRFKVRSQPTYLTHPWVLRHSTRGYLLNFDCFHFNREQFAEFIRNNGTTTRAECLVSSEKNLLLPKTLSEDEILVVHLRPTVPTLLELSYLRIARLLRASPTAPPRTLVGQLPDNMVLNLERQSDRYNVVPNLIRATSYLDESDHLSG